MGWGAQRSRSWVKRMGPTWSPRWKDLGQRTEQSQKMRTGIGQKERKTSGEFTD